MLCIKVVQPFCRVGAVELSLRMQDLFRLSVSPNRNLYTPYVEFASIISLDDDFT